MNRKLVPFLIFALVCATPALAAKEDKAARFYEDAVTRLEKNEAPAAIIQLKNALQQDPGMVSAHLLLGRAYLANAQPDAAQESLETAHRLGADRSQIVLPLSQALLAQGKGAEMLQRFPPESATLQERPELLILRAEALRQQGNPDAAMQSIQAALALDPRRLSALLAMADLLTKQGKFNEAARYADDALAVSPDNARAWYIRGTVSHGAGNVAKALQAYGKALELQTGLTDARLARIGILMDAARDAEVKPDLDYLKRESPSEPRAAYFRALYLSRTGDAEGTRVELVRVTDLLDPVPIEFLRARAPELLMIGALAHHGLQEMEKAQRYLEQFLATDPRNTGARKLLGTILIARKDYGRAIDVLEIGRRVSPRDPQMLSLLASAYMGVGKTQIAGRLLDEALKYGAGLPEVNATVGFRLLQSGQQDQAVQFLRTSFERDPGQVNIGTALSTLYVRRGDMKQALAVAEQMAKRSPGNPAVHNLLGAVRVAADDRRGGRAAYEKALQLNPGFEPAQLNLGKLEVMEGNLDAARTRFAAILKGNPKDSKAMYETARVELAAKRQDDAIRWLEKLRSTDPRHINGALLLAEVYVRAGQPQKAVEVAQAIQVIAPDNMEVQAGLAKALIAAKDFKGAQTILNRMTRVAEFDPGQQYQIAGLQVQAGNRQGAGYSLDKALSGRPDFLAARVLQVELDLAENRPDQAEARAKAIVKDTPGSAEGFRLLGDVAMARGRYPEAIANYKASMAKEPSTANLLGAFNGYLRSGAPASGVALLEGWIKQHPGDVLVQRALAEGYLRTGNLASAKVWYEKVRQAAGDDAMLLNNLAAVEDGMGNGAKALEHARSAHSFSPNDPMVLDTLGWLLVRQGTLDIGLKHLREARVRAPGNPEIRYHLSAGLAKAGRKDEAKLELTRLLEESSEFPGAEDARALLRQLGG